MRKSYWSYINNIISYDAEATPTENRTNNKKFWSFIKSKRQTATGIQSLKVDGKLIDKPCDKANALNNQFKSVFSLPRPLSPTHGSPNVEKLFDPMPEIFITTVGIEKLLSNINPFKAFGPDRLKPRVLKELSSEIAPILKLIFCKSLETGVIPSDWKNANVTPIFKKGSKSNPENYRPISLTCICSKIMEHIIVSNIMCHAEINKILSNNQHGFRKQLSCETQLLSFVQELQDSIHMGLQIDAIFLDFAKAFDKVPHNRLVQKLSAYGIQGKTLLWIENFLADRTQKVVLDNVSSDEISVSSGVPQGSVIGPCLFLFYINDLPNSVSSSARLFADDTVVYRAIKCAQDIQILQADLNSLETWAKNWQMDFNADKCQHIQFTRNRCKITSKYYLNGTLLQNVKDIKYLGLTLTNDLKWNTHIQNISAKARGMLGFLQRNLKISTSKTKEIAYFALVRPCVEYCSTAWDPYTANEVNKLEMVQRKAARYVCNDYGRTSSVSTMINKLGWRSLQDRRSDSRLMALFKVHHRQMPSFPNLLPDKSIPIGLSVQPSMHDHMYAIQPPMHHLRYTVPLMNRPTNYFNYSFLPRTVCEWNALPLNIVTSPTIASFKSQLQNFSRPIGWPSLQI